MSTWRSTPTKTIEVDGVTVAYRELGEPGGVPVVFLHHFTAVLDDWDPRVLDGIAAHHHVIAFDNFGVGNSGSDTPADLEKMGADAISIIRALGYEQVDLLGFSLGGAVAQMVALQAPDLVQSMVLAGTGPRGGGGIWKMPFIVGGAYAKSFLTRKDPRNFLFFPRTAIGKQAANEYFARLPKGPRTSTAPSRSALGSRSSVPSPAPDCTPPTTSPGSQSRSWSPTGTTTSWLRATTRPTWRRDSPTRPCASTPTRATEACSSTTASSYPRS